MSVNDEATVQIVLPMNTTTTMNIIGNEAIFEFMFRKRGLGRFAKMRLQITPDIG